MSPTVGSFILTIVVFAFVLYAMNNASKSFKAMYLSMLFLIIGGIGLYLHYDMFAGAMLLMAVSAFLRLPIGKDRLRNDW